MLCFTLITGLRNILQTRISLDDKNKYSLRIYTLEKCGERILVKLFQGSGIIMEEEDAERS